MSWTKAQHWSFWIHSTVVAIPFTASTVSALLFWGALFGTYWWLSIPLVLSIEVLALAGLVMYILHIPSPFTLLRHVLPFISVVPLGWELYQLLAHNGPWVAVPVVVVVVAVLVLIAWQCYLTIERLFNPVEAAMQQAEDHTRMLRAEGGRALATNAIINGFVEEWQRSQQESAHRLLIGPQEVYPRPQAAYVEDIAAPQAASGPAASPQEAAPQPRKADAVPWETKVAVYEARTATPAVSWSELEVIHNRSTATLRGWATQVEKARKGEA